MINSEDKVRLALQIVGIVMVWVSGFEWLAVVLLLAVLPWTPIYPMLQLIAAVGGWMAQPVADKVEERLIKTHPSDAARTLEEMLRVE